MGHEEEHVSRKKGEEKRKATSSRLKDERGTLGLLVTTIRKKYRLAKRTPI